MAPRAVLVCCRLTVITVDGSTGFSSRWQADSSAIVARVIKYSFFMDDYSYSMTILVNLTCPLVAVPVLPTVKKAEVPESEYFVPEAI